MASISSANINELLPGIEDFLRSMSHSTNLDLTQRQVANMYLNKIDQFSQLTNQQTSLIDNESDEFTDEDEEHQFCNSQWDVECPKTISDEKDTLSTMNEQRRSSTATTSSTSSNILADGLLLTYDKNHNWIWRYYILDNYDLICYSVDQKSRQQTDIHSSPVWLSDMTNAKIQLTTIDKIECIRLQIGLAEAVHVRSTDPIEMKRWLKAFQQITSTQKSKENRKTHRNVRTLSRNARRMFAQFNRKKGQLVSHFLDQMATVTGIDDKSRKHYELRGFLVLSFDNCSFVTKYCTIIDGCLRIHKSRLSDQTDHVYDLNNCLLAFPEERTRDIQFALIEKKTNEKIFIRGNHIYTMGRLLNTLAKYVEIKGSLQSVFQNNKENQQSNRIKDVYSDVKNEKVGQEENVDDVYDQPDCFIEPKPRIQSLNCDQPCVLPRRLSIQTYDRVEPVRVYDIPITIERPRRFYDIDDEPTVYDNLSKTDDGIGQYRFVIPFHHSSQSAFTKIRPHRSPTSSSSSVTTCSNSTLPQTSTSSNYSTANSNNNNNNRPPPSRRRLMTAV